MKASTLAKPEIKECCPEFHPEKWDEKTFSWNKKPFIKESIPELFHIPFPPMIAKKVAKMTDLAQSADRLPENKEDILLLFMDPSPFKSELRLAVTGKVPRANNTTLTGTFVSKVFKGNYSSIPKALKEMRTYLEDQNKKTDNYYVHYAYCPKCASKAGHNYLTLFAQVDE